MCFCRRKKQIRRIFVGYHGFAFWLNLKRNDNIKVNVMWTLNSRSQNVILR